MDDLPSLFEDLMAFISVVDAGGFNAAGTRFGTPPSRLSRSVAALEKHMGVSLIVRTTRRFAVTEIGQRTYEDAVRVRGQFKDAIAAASESQLEPSGTLRISCPMAMASEIVGRIAIDFMARHPQVHIAIETTDGRNRPFSEPADLAIQPSLTPLRDSSLVARPITRGKYILVASPRLQLGLSADPGPQALSSLPAVGWTFFSNPALWTLSHPEHGEHNVAVDARLMTDNLLLVREAAIGGVGVAQLPESLCRSHLESGQLCVVAPRWSPPQMTIYVLYPSRSALTLSGRMFVDALVAGLAPAGPADEPHRSIPAAQY
ncbi:MAG: LysR family transcriptional regulator [Proteobacteria bacterium]|nr:LysR family transcriptional regulator [Pseudomonadota bacterium]